MKVILAATALIVALSIDAVAQNNTAAPPPREIQLEAELASCQAELAELKRPVPESDEAYLQTIEQMQQRIEENLK